MAKILGIGDSMCDRNMTTGVMYPGGQSLNIPVNAKLQGADAAFMGCMGNDEVMEHLLRTMDELGVDHSHCRFYPVPSHTAYYKVAGNERVFLDPPPVKPNPMSEVLYSMMAYEGFSEDDWAYFERFDVIHCSNDSRIEALFPEMQRRNLKISFDFSTDYGVPGYMERVCPFVSVALLSCAEKSDGEVRALLRACHDLGTAVAIGTRGENGSVCFDGERYWAQEICRRERVVDTMGAGDAFLSAFLVKYIDEGGEGAALPEIMRYAANYAADSCMVNGSFGHGIAFKLH